MTCPLCGGPAGTAFITTDRNRGITNLRFTYGRCRSCDTLFLLDVPADLGPYYPQEYYRLPSPTELDQLARAEQYKLDFIRPYAGSGSLIEIGAGFGLFSRAAEQAGYDVTAIEMDARCCEYLTSTVGVRAIRSIDPAAVLPELPRPLVVAMWHVMEHLRDPWRLLDVVAARLAPGGVLAIAMPNPRAVQFRLLRGRWAHVDAPRHLFLIPPATLTARASQLGLETAHVTTTDPAGRHWNRFGWEYAVRRRPASTPSTRLKSMASLALTLLLRPVEEHGLNGAAYTAVFVKPAIA